MAKFILFVDGILAARYDSDIHGDNIPEGAIEVSDDLFFQTINETDGVWKLVNNQITKHDFEPETLSELKARLVFSVDGAVSDVYNEFTRFSLEYEQREKAAQAFKDAGYTGDATVWVTAFATAAGKTNQEAADIILAQALQLRTALENLGAQRMRKFSILAASNKTTANSVFADIVATVEAIAAAL